MRMFSLLLCFVATASFAQSDTPNNPTWWDKFEYLFHNGPLPSAGATTSTSSGGNVAGSNEIFRLPMRGYSSSDGGKSWSGVDLPLPPVIGANGVNFGSDPTLAFDSR